MNTLEESENGTITLCRKLHEVPPLITDWQQPAWCPDCDHYDQGRCRQPIRRDGNMVCPFDNLVLPLKELGMEVPNTEPGSLLDVGLGETWAIRPLIDELKEVVKLKVIDRTGGQIRAVEIELTDAELVVRGIAPSYYVKQLALHAALDVLHSACEPAVALRLEVDVVPRRSMDTGDCGKSDLKEPQIVAGEEWP